jgi:hypothetical protein
MSSKSPEEQACDRFLARQLSWVRKWLQGDYLLTSAERAEVLNGDWIEIYGQAADEYLKLLVLCPRKYRAYREREVKSVLSWLTAVPAGAPRKDGLAQEAIALKRAGFSYAKIAMKLNSKYGEGTTKAGAIYQLIRSRSKDKP